MATLVARWLETGRTHQIRIHLAELGHPVVGDAVYRPRNQPRTKARFARQALHAQTLGFVHLIITADRVHVEDFSPDLDGLILDLRRGADTARGRIKTATEGQVQDARRPILKASPAYRSLGQAWWAVP